MATERLTISCDDCIMAGTECCADCVVSFIVGGTVTPVPEPVRLSDEQAGALRTLADVGLVAELRFAPRAAS